MSKRPEFTRKVQALALKRQKGRCATCATPIACLGEKGREQHAYGESAHAHHILHAKFGGTNAVDNCVIICESCHYCVHEGGNYRHGTAIGYKEDFPHFDG